MCLTTRTQCSHKTVCMAQWIPSCSSLVMNFPSTKNCSSCSLILFTVITDKHSAVISVQVVDDVGYSLCLPVGGVPVVSMSTHEPVFTMYCATACNRPSSGEYPPSRTSFWLSTRVRVWPATWGKFLKP